MCRMGGEEERNRERDKEEQEGIEEEGTPKVGSHPMSEILKKIP